MNKIQNPNNTVRNADLNKRWKETMQIQNMIRKSKKCDSTQIMQQREEYLIQKKLSKFSFESVIRQNYSNDNRQSRENFPKVPGLLKTSTKQSEIELVNDPSKSDINSQTGKDQIDKETLGSNQHVRDSIKFGDQPSVEKSVRFVE